MSLFSFLHFLFFGWWPVHFVTFFLYLRRQLLCLIERECNRTKWRSQRFAWQIFLGNYFLRFRTKNIWRYCDFLWYHIKRNDRITNDREHSRRVLLISKNLDFMVEFPIFWVNYAILWCQDYVEILYVKTLRSSRFFILPINPIDGSPYCTSLLFLFYLWIVSNPLQW